MLHPWPLFSREPTVLFESLSNCPRRYAGLVNDYPKGNCRSQSCLAHHSDGDLFEISFHHRFTAVCLSLFNGLEAVLTYDR